MDLTNVFAGKLAPYKRQFQIGGYHHSQLGLCCRLVFGWGCSYKFTGVPNAFYSPSSRKSVVNEVDVTATSLIDLTTEPDAATEPARVTEDSMFGKGKGFYDERGDINIDDEPSAQVITELTDRLRALQKGSITKLMSVYKADADSTDSTVTKLAVFAWVAPWLGLCSFERWTGISEHRDGITQMVTVLPRLIPKVRWGEQPYQPYHQDWHCLGVGTQRDIKTALKDKERVDECMATKYGGCYFVHVFNINDIPHFVPWFFFNINDIPHYTHRCCTMALDGVTQRISKAKGMFRTAVTEALNKRFEYLPQDPQDMQCSYCDEPYFLLAHIVHFVSPGPYTNDWHDYYFSDFVWDCNLELTLYLDQLIKKNTW